MVHYNIYSYTKAQDDGGRLWSPFGFFHGYGQGSVAVDDDDVVVSVIEPCFVACESDELPLGYRAGELFSFSLELSTHDGDESLRDNELSIELP